VLAAAVCRTATAGSSYRDLSPPVVADLRNAPVNTLGYLRVMFAVDDLDDTLARLRGQGAQLVGEVA
jgi:hypothetical protein